MLETYGWLDLIITGLVQIRKLFPQPGLTDRRKEVPITESYPGNVSLFDFILKYGHEKEDMIKM